MGIILRILKGGGGFGLFGLGWIYISAFVSDVDEDTVNEVKDVVVV
jgi:hypothetical protein